MQKKKKNNKNPSNNGSKIGRFFGQKKNQPIFAPLMG
ncbi:unnamed protein product [Staurois parvus]|uniref:Uncharacterized protein n=1 Tax=Staurois parvus TaxID=386267 RepID=A0ABN9E2M2_9NEOB|nr:unnamed protein product [Staurois parvus]